MVSVLFIFCALTLSPPDLDMHFLCLLTLNHIAFGDEEEKVDPKSLGLREKKEVPVGPGIKMKRLHWDPTDIKSVKGTIWEDLDESKISYDHKHFELHFQVRQRKPVDEQKVCYILWLHNSFTIYHWILTEDFAFFY